MRTLALLALLAWPARAADLAAARLIDALELSPEQSRLVAAAAGEAVAAGAEERAALQVQERRIMEVGRTLLRRAGSPEPAPAWLQARWHEADRAGAAAKARTRQRLRELSARIRAGLRPGQLAALDEATHYSYPPAQEEHSAYADFLDRARAASGGPADLRGAVGRMMDYIDESLPSGIPLARAAAQRSLLEAARRVGALPEARYALGREELARELKRAVVSGRPELDPRARIARFLLQPGVLPVLEGRLAAKI